MSANGCKYGSSHGTAADVLWRAPRLVVGKGDNDKVCRTEGSNSGGRKEYKDELRNKSLTHTFSSDESFLLNQVFVCFCLLLLLFSRIFIFLFLVFCCCFALLNFLNFFYFVIS